MINPFITSGYAGAEYFCDREKETESLVRLLLNGNNVALISPRRYGKTDLIRHCFSQPGIKDKYYTFIIDIYSTKTYSEMVSAMGKSILDTLKPMGRKAWEQFINVALSLRPGIVFDAYGTPSWTLGLNALPSPTVTLDEIFKYLQNADRPCIVAIDEFQQITKYEDDSVEARLRTAIQYCSNAKFIFSGSQRHIMGTMFTSPARPFYQSVTLFYLSTIPLDKYLEFCQRLFADRERFVTQEVVAEVYERFEGVTFYIQRVMNELFALTNSGEECLPAQIDTAIDNIIAYSSSIYEDLMYQLPVKQAGLLKAIAIEGHAVQLTSGRFSKKHNLASPSSVKSALPALLDKGLVTHDKNVYQVYDKFLALWIMKNCNLL